MRLNGDEYVGLETLHTIGGLPDTPFDLVFLCAMAAERNPAEPV